MTTPVSRSSPWPAYVWPQGRSSAFCFTVDVDAHSPLLWGLREQPASKLVGQFEQRLFGPRVGIWRLLDLLARHGIQGSFFVPAVVAEAYPELLPAFVRGGHEVGLHGFFHEIVAHTSDAEFSAALDASLALFQQQVGLRPKGFRSPAWEMTPHMMAELQSRGMYDSSLSGFDNPYTLGGVVEVPVQWAIDDAVYFKFLGGGVDHWPPSASRPVLETWTDEWETLHAEGGLFMLTVHDWISGRAHRIRLLDTLLSTVTRTPGAWIATVGEVAAYHAESVNSDRFMVPLSTPEPIASRRFVPGP
jgi:peptidoglycan/xylan/chitin deacetylase (PgdA/CDA1 family)